MTYISNRDTLMIRSEQDRSKDNHNNKSIRNGNTMQKTYYSHYRPRDGVYQTNQEHERNVAVLSEEYCRISKLKKTAWLIGLHHDDGKNTESWQEYFQASIHQGKSGGEKEDHSTLGGLLLDLYEPNTRFSEMVQNAIYMHHGLADCISTVDSSPLIRRRKQKISSEAVESARSIAQSQFPEEDMQARCREAKRDINALTKRMLELSGDGSGNRVFGDPNFYVGMCERMLSSCLIDADWRDTADFMDDRVTTTGMSDDEIQKVWEKGIGNLEKRIAGFEQKEKIDSYRSRISDQCKEAAFWDHNLYQLAVPTGAGKTLSSLRFALYCAKEHHKRHIFYVAPFKSILEQNAEEIRKTLDMPEMVLEHHSDVVQDDEKLWRYERLIENWDEVPVIVTTAVQFLNTLFKEKRSNVRRFHSLCDSVIIVDEAQALPIRTVGLFNLAVNFLTRICNTTVVLCTATQPLFSDIRENRMLPSRKMTEGLSAFEEAFRRVEYHDCTENCGGGLSAEQAAAFVREKAQQFEQILLILNTKSCAKQVYEQLEGTVEGRLFHLSTLMCAQHRSDVLEEIRKALADGEKVICISTQLVEAGVDFSFQCVIRSLAGLDNLIQAAGRCNRNGSLEVGHVFLIKMSNDVENVASIPDIKKAQDAMLSFLHTYRGNPEEFGHRLDSEKAIRTYYLYYFYARQNEMCYHVNVNGVQTDLVELLSTNRLFAGGRKEPAMKQAFRSAGEAFTVIEEKGGTDVVVSYGESEELINALQREDDPDEKRKILRKLQRYTVNLSDAMMRRMGSGAVYGIEENRVMKLDSRYYEQSTGVREEPGKMPFLNM